MHADPEGLVHDAVGLGERAADAVGQALHVGLAREVAGKQQPRANFLLLEVAQQVEPRHRAGFAQGDRKAKPRRVGVGAGLGQL